MTDYVWDDVRELNGGGYDYLNHAFIIIVLKISDNLLVIPDGRLFIQHNGITHSKKKDLIRVFETTIGRQYKWSGKQTRGIELKL